MEKRVRGEIRVHERRDGQLTYSLRFRVDGKRQVVTLGKDSDGWTYPKAERKLDDVLAQVRAGVWQPPTPVGSFADEGQTFHEFASRWWAARQSELRPRTQENYEWRLKKHLLPFFADYLMSEIDVAWWNATARRRSSIVSESVVPPMPASRYATSEASAACH